MTSLKKPINRCEIKPIADHQKQKYGLWAYMSTQSVKPSKGHPPMCEKPESPWPVTKTK